MRLDLHYTESRLVELYDRDNPRGADTDFYLALANDKSARRIIDLGCGTGLLTCELALNGRQVIGIDPSPAMLAIAKRKPAAELVKWIEGDADSLGAFEADLSLMTGNVAQVFLDDIEWDTVLNALYRALKPEGYLAFESRNPLARAWETWVREKTYEQVETPFGPLECWLELRNIEEGRVRFAGYNIFKNTGEELIVESELRFRTHTELTDSLVKAGFTIEQLYGNWQKDPFTPSSRHMIFVARRD